MYRQLSFVHVRRSEPGPADEYPWFDWEKALPLPGRGLGIPSPSLPPPVAQHPSRSGGLVRALSVK